MSGSTPRSLGSVLVTGAAGQDGAYLCRDLLALGHEVYATLRPGTDIAGLWRWNELGISAHPHLHRRELEVSDAPQCRELFAAIAPDQVFHLAAISGVASGYVEPQRMFAINAVGCVNLLDALRRERSAAQFIYAASSEMYSADTINEDSAVQARHPYALSKLAGHAAVRCYRDSYGLAASSAILFNHESPLRGAGFVTRKIAAAAACPQVNVVSLGNLDAQRDFGYAPEYVAAMRAMALQDLPGDYVLASGVLTSIREFASLVYAAAGITLVWKGRGADELAQDMATGKTLLRVDPALWRPNDRAYARGDARLARKRLGFAPTTDVAALAALMLAAERRRAATLPSTTPI